MAIHIFGFLIWPAARDNPDVRLQPGEGMHAPKNVHMQQTWMIVIADYLYFLQDYFLLPQILSNLLMPTHVRSLMEAYYLGFASIRLLGSSFTYQNGKIGIHESELNFSIVCQVCYSIGSLLGEYWYQHNRNTDKQIEESCNSNTEIIEISGHLTITSQHYNNISLSFEGLYDRILGKMHLVGFRDVRYLPKI
ncbi:Protein of unknown function DUF2921 - like 9 [Theobroma cacao]|nr:Protein of unknown function DUF2921 - like 9 [Theobroma cacao]